MGTDKADFYFNTYSQRGGDFPVFRGARYIQYGSGFGDVLRGIFRHVFPIIAKGATTFLSDLLQKQSQGEGWKGAAKSAMGTAAQAALGQASAQISQTGSGKKKRKRKHKRGKRKKKSKVYKGSKNKAKRQKLAAHIPQFNF